MLTIIDFTSVRDIVIDAYFDWSTVNSIILDGWISGLTLTEDE